MSSRSCKGSSGLPEAKRFLEIFDVQFDGLLRENLFLRLRVDLMYELCKDGASRMSKLTDGCLSQLEVAYLMHVGGWSLGLVAASPTIAHPDREFGCPWARRRARWRVSRAPIAILMTTKWSSKLKMSSSQCFLSWSSAASRHVATVYL